MSIEYNDNFNDDEEMTLKNLNKFDNLNLNKEECLL